MPIVRIQMVEGRSAEQKTKLMKAVTEAIHTSIGAPLSSIHVLIQDLRAENVMVAGRLVSQRDKNGEP